MKYPGGGDAVYRCMNVVALLNNHSILYVNLQNIEKWKWGMTQTSEAFASVFITEQLLQRPSPRRNYKREKSAFRDILSQMVGNPSDVLPRLVELALELCEAVAGGVSLYETSGNVFRWHHLKGSLETFSGATTPRDYSPCGITLDQRSVVLVERPERVYSWLLEAGVTIPECLLVPLYLGGKEPLRTLWIVSHKGGHFNKNHAAVMHELAELCGIALHMINAEAQLKATLGEQEMLTKEMGHRVKNLFSIADGMIRMTARSSSTKDEMAEVLSGRLRALAAANALVLRNIDSLKAGSDITEVIGAVLKPYAHLTIDYKGSTCVLGEQGTSTVALILHELATNAAKYGALATESGTLSINWRCSNEKVLIVWEENGVTLADGQPKVTGFGSALINNTIKLHRGEIEYHWKSDGLRVNITMDLEHLRH